MLPSVSVLATPRMNSVTGQSNLTGSFARIILGSSFTIVRVNEAESAEMLPSLNVAWRTELRRFSLRFRAVSVGDRNGNDRILTSERCLLAEVLYGVTGDRCGRLKTPRAVTSNGRCAAQPILTVRGVEGVFNTTQESVVERARVCLALTLVCRVVSQVVPRVF